MPPKFWRVEVQNEVCSRFLSPEDCLPGLQMVACLVSLHVASLGVVCMHRRGKKKEGCPGYSPYDHTAVDGR